MVRLQTLAAPLVLLLVLTGCAGQDAEGDLAAPSTAPSAQPSPSPSPAPVAAVDWNDPAHLALRDDWAVGPCDGEAPLVCFLQSGVAVGVGEVTSFPVDTLPTVQAALQAGEGEAGALQAHAREYLDVFRADRTKGCAGVFTAAPVTALTAGGEPAIKTAFTVGEPGAPATERVVRWVGLREGHLVSLVVHATDEGACVEGEGLELSTAQLAELEPLLDQLVAASPLPQPSA